MLELERILKAAKSELTIYRAQELVKNMYAITYTLPKSKQTKRVYLGMDEDQSELCSWLCRVGADSLGGAWVSQRGKQEKLKT